MRAETVEYHRVLIEATIRIARTLGMVTGGRRHRNRRTRPH
jgi:hypothetical protein